MSASPLLSESCTSTGVVAIGIRRTVVRRSEQSFGGNFALAARAFWPIKTAEQLAARAGCSVRAAEFYLAGKREWSKRAIGAVMAKLFE